MSGCTRTDQAVPVQRHVSTCACVLSLTMYTHRRYTVAQLLRRGQPHRVAPNIRIGASRIHVHIGTGQASSCSRSPTCTNVFCDLWLHVLSRHGVTTVSNRRRHVYNKSLGVVCKTSLDDTVHVQSRHGAHAMFHVECRDGVASTRCGTATI